MIRNVGRIISILLFFLAWFPGPIAQAQPSLTPPIDTESLNESYQKHNVLELEMPVAQYKKVITAKGQKLRLKNTALKFNGQLISIDEIHLHGNTTLNFERKSFSVDAAQKIKFCDEGCKPLDAFYLISLSMDKNYYHNRLCFDMLKTLKLFDLQYQYTEVKINGITQGIYLMMQRPQDWSKKVAQSPFIIRRGLNHVVTKERVKKNMDRDSVKMFRQQFAAIYKVINHYSGEKLYAKLNEILVVDDYLRWLAFNYIVKNGDYSDELYFYIDPETSRYKIIPWDYDDVFKAEPHEGMEAWKMKMNAGSLIFSSEDELDVAIAHDPFLYKKYLEQLAFVMNDLTEAKIAGVLHEVYEDLFLFFSSDAILQTSSKDGYKTSADALQKEVVIVSQYFSYIRSVVSAGLRTP